ncbi:MAG: ribose-phosphate diphosphokinase [Candidatus Thermoplasmatota archaeon]|nr:ribose-phosphate diphosphokinase [Candidatus Thermoplasmatota archaeon]MCL5732225.1 ribose-phosphate diphosphokinase [Candidatus Thermoplasmatota archaeon]
MLIVPSSSSLKLAKSVAEISGSTLSDVERKRFPDGEMYVRILSETLNMDVAVLGNTRTDSDILEMLLLLNAAREGGAKRVIAVIPYFGYARQHMRYKDGEPVSSKVITQALDNSTDEIICVEIHDEQTLNFSSKPFRNLSAERSMTDHFMNHVPDYVLSPDDGGYDRAKKLAESIGTRAAYIFKKRIDPKTVEMKLPDIDFSGRTILLVDDIISTGGTIIKAIKLLRQAGASRISVAAVHGVFARDSDRIISSEVDELAVCDTIDGPYSTISIAGTIAGSLER